MFYISLNRGNQWWMWYKIVAFASLSPSRSWKISQINVLNTHPISWLHYCHVHHSWIFFYFKSCFFRFLYSFFPHRNAVDSHFGVHFHNSDWFSITQHLVEFHSSFNFFLSEDRRWHFGTIFKITVFSVYYNCLVIWKGLINGSWRWNSKFYKRYEHL